MSTATPDLTQMTPPQIDELWAQAMQPAYQIDGRLREARRDLKRYRKHGQEPKFLLERIEKLEDRLAEARKAGDPYDAEFDRRGGWPRYLIVAGTGGHVHRQYCHTLTPGVTLVQPIFALSGRDDDGVVADCGHVACSHCFPDAPVITREVRERQTAERKAAKDAEREAKRREKLARAADRARKLIVKYERLVPADIRDNLAALTYNEAYDAHIDLPAQVGNLLLDDFKRAHGEQGWDRDPREIVAEAEALGL